MGVLHLFFGFNGRINRGKYWLALVVWLLVWIVAIPAFVIGGLATGQHAELLGGAA